MVLARSYFFSCASYSNESKYKRKKKKKRNTVSGTIVDYIHSLVAIFYLKMNLKSKD